MTHPTYIPPTILDDFKIEEDGFWLKSMGMEERKVAFADIVSCEWTAENTLAIFLRNKNEQSLLVSQEYYRLQELLQHISKSVSGFQMPKLDVGAEDRIYINFWAIAVGCFLISLLILVFRLMT